MTISKKTSAAPADEAFGATHKATYRDVGNAMNHEYTDAAVEQRESHEDESQD